MSDSARQAWGLLTELVYPPPFLAIVRALDLSPASFGAMRVLDEPRTMSEIARQLKCDNSNVTGIVDGLEERGLASRRSAAGDRRVKMVELSAEGRGMRARLMEAVAEPPEWLVGLSDADRRTLRDLLQRALDERD